MGNRFSRRRNVSINSAETAVTAEEPATTQPGGDSGMTATQEAVKTENLDVVVGKEVTPVACLPTEECVSECKEAEAPASAPLNDAEPEPEAKETPAPVQPEPLVSVSTPSPPEPEPVAAEPTSDPQVDVEAVPEPISEPVPAPAEALEQEADLLTQESLPEPMISPPPLVDLGAPDVTPQLIDTPISVPVNADEPSDIPAVEEFQDGAEAVVISTLEPEKSEETTESLEEPIEAEAAGNLEQIVSDVNEESVSGLLKHLELTGNDLVTDLIHSDVKIPDDTPIVDISTPTELM
ncbi:uncharacterized protein [Thunnus thynnus]|uniref:uncharacterized protein n=1 Tax=Thunnus thynnus TaxID=8237 RepID=UPI0035276D4F|eukprot:superscaffoldBa00000144_g2092